MLKHLLEMTDVRIVYVAESLEHILEESGFSEMKEGAKELMDELDMTCGVSEKQAMVIMIYDKK